MPGGEHGGRRDVRVDASGFRDVVRVAVNPAVQAVLSVCEDGRHCERPDGPCGALDELEVEGLEVVGLVAERIHVVDAGESERLGEVRSVREGGRSHAADGRRGGARKLELPLVIEVTAEGTSVAAAVIVGWRRTCST